MLIDLCLSRSTLLVFVVLYVPAVLLPQYRWMTRYANSVLQCTPARFVKKDPKESHSAEWLCFKGRRDLVAVFLLTQEMGLGIVMIFSPSVLPSAGQCSLAL